MTPASAPRPATGRSPATNPFPATGRSLKKQRQARDPG